MKKYAIKKLGYDFTELLASTGVVTININEKALHPFFNFQNIAMMH